MLFTITTGIEREAKGQRINPERAERVITSAITTATLRFGGVSVTEHRGGYKGEGGAPVYERSVSFTIVTTLNDVPGDRAALRTLRADINKFAAYLRVALNQESVLVVEQAAAVEFI